MTGALDLRPLIPAAIVAFTGMVVLLVQAFTPEGKRAPSAPLAVVGLGGAFVSVLLLGAGPGRGAVMAGMLALDDFSLFLHLLVLGALLAIVCADMSMLSKAETERIWVPFTIWLSAAPALLPTQSHRWWLALNVVGALALNSFILTNW